MTPIDQTRIDANWRAIRIELDAPTPGVVERTLRACGLPSEVTRMMAATPALRRSWFVALFVVATIGLIALGDTQPRDAFFNVALLAPLVPVAGIAMAYSPSNDPAHEIELATPSKGLRLLLVRAATVQAVTTLVLGGVSLLMPVTASVSLGWLLPSLGLTSVVLGLMAVMAPRRAAWTGSLGWVGIMLVTSRQFDDRLDAFGPGTQMVASILVVLGLVVVRQQRDRFDLLRDAT